MTTGEYLYDPDDWADRLYLNTSATQGQRCRFVPQVAAAIAQRDRKVIVQALTKLMLDIDDSDGADEVRALIRGRIGGLS